MYSSNDIFSPFIHFFFYLIDLLFVEENEWRESAERNTELNFALCCAFCSGETLQFLSFCVIFVWPFFTTSDCSDLFPVSPFFILLILSEQTRKVRNMNYTEYPGRVVPRDYNYAPVIYLLFPGLHHHHQRRDIL